jgi:hypothetical protein
MRRVLTVAFASIALFTLSPVVFADVVGPLPASCPEGGQASTCHGGPHCRVLGCMADTDCQDGLVCKDRSFCVGVINCSGKLPPDADPSTGDVQTLESSCAAGDSCDAGGACTTLKVCVAANSTGSISSTGSSGSDPGANGSCGCRLGTSTERFGALALSFGTLVGLSLLRRKRR